MDQTDYCPCVLCGEVTDTALCTRCVPRQVQEKVTWALGRFGAWNQAITQCRRMEEVAGEPGRYEHEYRYGEAGASLWILVQSATETLATFERYAGKNKVDVEAVYAALGGKPTLLPEGPQVQSWRPRPR